MLKKNHSLKEIRVTKDVDREKVASISSDVTLHEWSSYARTLMAFGGFSPAKVKSYFETTSTVTKHAFAAASDTFLIELPEKFDTEEYFRVVESLIL